MQAPNPMTNSRTLGPDGGLRYFASGCLPVRYPDEACGLCADACPVSAITVTAGSGIAVGTDCSGCGQCAAVCPTSALVADGFAVPVPPKEEVEEIQVDCWRVPHAQSVPGAVRVPCLGGITSGWLAALSDAADCRPIYLMERGYCAACPSGKGMTELGRRVSETRTLLFQAGVAIDSLPAITSMPSRVPPLPGTPSAVEERRTSRRGFLRDFVGTVVRGVDEVAALRAETDDPIVLREAALPVGQLRLATALGRIAARHGRGDPQLALPQLTIADCSGHGICSRVCPTKALLRTENGEAAELRFDATRCVACGQCVRTCPDRALRLQPTGGRMQVEVLATWAGTTCTQCGEVFYGDGGSCCPGCLKNQQLLQGMAAMFRPSR